MFRGNDIGLDKGKGDLWQIRGTQFRANALKGKRSKTRRGCATATRSQNLQIGNFPSPHQTLPRLLILKSRLPPSASLVQKTTLAGMLHKYVFAGVSLSHTVLPSCTLWFGSAHGVSSVHSHPSRETCYPTPFLLPLLAFRLT